MPIPSDLIFDTTSDWAVRAAEGFVSGRLPQEDTFLMKDLMSRLSWNSNHLDAQVSLLGLDKLRSAVAHGEQATAGPYRDVESVRIPKFASDLLRLPPESSTPQVAKVLFTQSTVPVTVHRIPTCTDKGVFTHLTGQEHPVHPVLEFGKPVGFVHVRMSDGQKQLLWDATYDLKGQWVLNNTINASVEGESLVPDYIPACSVGKTVMRLDIDAEDPEAPMRIDFINPNPPSSDAMIVKPKLVTDKPQVNHTPMLEIEKADAVVCKVTHKSDHQTDFVPINSKASVKLPGKYGEALWRLDRSREESSDRNPHGIPMMDTEATSKIDVPPGLGRNTVNEPPSGVSVGGKSVLYLSRRPDLGGEIQIDQLEAKKFQVFDGRKMPQYIQLVDKTAHEGSRGGFAQPTVERASFSPMWQGIHSKDVVKNLHPSISFKHPASVARVVMKDLTDKRTVWDAVFNVQGNHKIAADQVPVGGTMPKFSGINPAPNKPHMYSISVDADNPSLDIPDAGDRMINFWRHSEFLFGATRPVDHASIDVSVASKSGSSSLFRS